jgi:hypothetical protein
LKNDKKKLEKIEKIDEEAPEEPKLPNNKIFESLAYLYQHQLQLEKNQERIEEKLDEILKILKKQKT